MSPPGREGSRRGRPRSEAARLATLDAAAELLLERGLGDVSMDAIAEHAGVSKATIYRWWPTKEMLALDALYADWEAAQSALPDTGSLRRDLLGSLRAWVRLINRRPYARVIAALVAEAHSDPELMRVYHERFIHARRERARTIFRRAIERGELAAGTDVEVALDCIYGPLYHRFLHRHLPLNEKFLCAVVDVTLAGLR